MVEIAKESVKVEMTVGVSNQIAGTEIQQIKDEKIKKNNN